MAGDAKYRRFGISGIESRGRSQLGAQVVKSRGSEVTSLSFLASRVSGVGGPIVRYREWRSHDRVKSR
jgi:hypothetical protein